MAKANNTNRSTAYTFAAILLALVTAINMFLVFYLFNSIQSIGRNTSTTMNTINSINGELQSINQRVLTIIAGIGTQQSQEATADSIEVSFDSIEEKFNTFENYEGLSEATTKRCRHARVFVEAYRKRLTSLRDQLNSQEGLSSGGSLADIYTQDIYPLKTTASEMLVATININGADSSRKQAKSAKIFIYTELIMALVLFLVSSPSSLSLQETRRFVLNLKSVKRIFRKLVLSSSQPDRKHLTLLLQTSLPV